MRVQVVLGNIIEVLVVVVQAAVPLLLEGLVEGIFQTCPAVEGRQLGILPPCTFCIPCVELEWMSGATRCHRGSELDVVEKQHHRRWEFVRDAVRYSLAYRAQLRSLESRL